MKHVYLILGLKGGEIGPPPPPTLLVAYFPVFRIAAALAKWWGFEVRSDYVPSFCMQEFGRTHYLTYNHHQHSVLPIALQTVLDTLYRSTDCDSQSGRAHARHIRRRCLPPCRYDTNIPAPLASDVDRATCCALR